MESSCRGSKSVSFLAGITIVNSRLVFMDLYSLLANGDVSRRRIGPATRVVVAGAFPFYLDGLMGVSAKDVICPVVFCIGQGPGRNLGCKPQPCAVETVEKLAE